MNKKLTQTGLFGTEKAVEAFRKAAILEKAHGKSYVNATDSGIRELGSFETTAKFKSQSITQVDIYRRNGPKPLSNPNSIDNLLFQKDGVNAYNGYLSPATKRTLEQMLQVWLTAIELNVDLKQQPKEVSKSAVFPTFVTLTLPSQQLHGDNDIKAHMLHPFLDWLKMSSDDYYKRGELKGQQKGFGVKAYFWRAEPQKNGNIHFHILVDRFIPWERIRQKWNEIVEKHGYITRYKYVNQYFHRNGFRMDEQQMRYDKENLIRMAEVVQEQRAIPYKVHPVFKSYLEVVAKTGKPLRPNMISAAAKEKQFRAYEEAVKCGWTNPNTTDIHGVQNLDSIAAYVIKYVTKKPTELPLKDNQELKFSEEFKRDCISTYEYIENELTGEVEKKEVDMQFYTPQFEERRINGRLWGCADILRGMKLEEKQVLYEDENGYKYIYEVSPEIENEIDYIPLPGQGKEELEVVTPVKKPFYELKYFTRVVEESLVVAPSNRDQTPIYTEKEVVCQMTKNYLDLIINKVGPQMVNSASLKVGPSFERMRGKIIPLNPEKLGFKPKKGRKKAHVQHGKIMERYAPDLFKEYLNHHRHIFYCIYGDIA